MTLLYCWMDKTSYMEEKYGPGSHEHLEVLFNNGTCLLEKDHEGEHEFIDDENITITFLPNTEE